MEDVVVDLEREIPLEELKVERVNVSNEETPSLYKKIISCFNSAGHGKEHEIIDPDSNKVTEKVFYLDDIFYLDDTNRWIGSHPDPNIIPYVITRHQEPFNHEDITIQSSSNTQPQPLEGEYQIVSRKLGDKIITLVTPAQPGIALDKIAKLLDFESEDEQNASYLELLEDAEAFCWDFNNNEAILNIRRFFRRFERVIPHQLGNWKMFSLNDPEGIPLSPKEMLKITSQHLPTDETTESKLLRARTGGDLGLVDYNQKDEPYILWTEDFDGVTFSLVRDGISPRRADKAMQLVKEQYKRVKDCVPNFLVPQSILIHTTNSLWARSYANIPDRDKDNGVVMLYEDPIKEDQEQTCRHELAHNFFMQYFGGSLSEYLAEGVAMFYGSQEGEKMADYLLKEIQLDWNLKTDRGWSRKFDKLLEKEDDLRKYEIDDDTLEYYGGSLFVEYLLKQGGINKLLHWYKMSSSWLIKSMIYGRVTSDHRVLSLIDRHDQRWNPIKLPHNLRADIAAIRGSDLFTDNFIKYVREQADEFQRGYSKLMQQHQLTNSE